MRVHAIHCLTLTAASGRWILRPMNDFPCFGCGVARVNGPKVRCPECKDARRESRREVVPGAPTSRNQILDAQTGNGGWTRAQLAEWGIPWPPPKGWRKALEARIAAERTDE